MALSKNWIDSKEIYKNEISMRDFSKRIYRDPNGFEAFVVDENEDTFTIEGNGVRCKIWKKFTKSKIKKVSEDYVLRKFSFSK